MKLNKQKVETNNYDNREEDVIRESAQLLLDMELLVQTACGISVTQPIQLQNKQSINLSPKLISALEDGLSLLKIVREQQDEENEVCQLQGKNNQQNQLGNQQSADKLRQNFDDSDSKQYNQFENQKKRKISTQKLQQNFDENEFCHLQDKNRQQNYFGNQQKRKIKTLKNFDIKQKRFVESIQEIRDATKKVNEKRRNIQSQIDWLIHLDKQLNNQKQEYKYNNMFVKTNYSKPKVQTCK
eukprot:TRINITY_DN3673_c0_g2_i1.p1 TRINITY_DN3673_c0_g2~~TRINITY_DN3673_c0_g2_i1.p1  ORF type:complete len:241 (+),score=25.45 TRINITY_DN3673_c0_g2_i1:1-723(+)